MADIKKIMLIALVAILSLVSCSKEDDTTFMGIDTEFIENSAQSLEYDTDYYCELDTLVNELVTVEQYVDGYLVFKEGKKEVSRKPFTQNLKLNAKFEAEPEVVYVLKKENLSEVLMTASNATEEAKSDSVDGAFRLSSVKKNYTFNFNEGETVNVATLYESYSHKDTTFMHAAIKNVFYKEFDATLNEAVSNADSTVYNINLYFVVEVDENNENMAYKVRVPVKRIFKEAPAAAVTTIEDTEFKAEFAIREYELYTLEQYVKGYFVTRLGTEEIGRKMFKYDLNLNAKFTAEPTEIYVDSEAKLTDVSMKSSSNGGEKLSKTSMDNFTLTSVTKDYEFLFNEGEKVKAVTIYEKLSIDDTTFDYVEIKNVSYKDFEAVINNAETNEDKIVYNVTLLFNVEVVCDANSELTKTYVIPVFVKRIYAPEKPDVVETVIENKGYEAEFNTPALKLQTVKQFNTMDFVTYKNEEEVSRENVTRDLNLEAIFSAPGIVYVDSEDKLGTVTLSGSSKDGDRINNSNSAGFTKTTRSQNYNFRFNENEKVVSATEYEKEVFGEEKFDFSSIQNVRYKSYVANKNEAKSVPDSTVYDITLYFDVEVKHESNVETKASSTKTYQVAVPYTRVYKPADELVGKRAEYVTRRIVDANTEEISWTEVEIWTVSGEKKTSKTFKLYRNFNEPQLHWIYTKNADYNTVSVGKNFVKEDTSVNGYWSVTTRYEEYSSSADNAVNAFVNRYSYSYQKAVYKDEYYELNFDYADWSISEGNSNLTPTSNNTEKDGVVYDVYDYVNNISTTYYVSDDSYNATAQAQPRFPGLR
jgi:hypothetical protein